MPVELFTPESAAKLSKIGWEKRRTRQSELLNAEVELKALRAALAQSIPAMNANARALTLELELATISADMKGADADTKAKLASAYAKLFSAWCVLTDTKSPGVARGSKRQRPAEVQPIPPAESPASVQLPTQSKPLGWEYDG